MQLAAAAPVSFEPTDALSDNAIGVVLAYENLAAALLAVENLTKIFSHIDLGPRLRLSPWSFAMLGDAVVRSRAMAEAADAQLLVVATSSRSVLLPNAVEAWLRDCLNRPQGTISAVAAFLGLDGVYDRVDSPRFQTVQRLAEKAGCEFFAPNGAPTLAAGGA